MESNQGTSLDIKEAQLEKLKAAFPEAVCEGKVDWDKLRLTLGEDVVIANERYVLNWAGKSDAFRAIQTSTTATLKPQKEQSLNFSAKGGSASGGDTTENIFIEGENLEVLKVLQKSYYGKVKMIYIDPPYNTGNDSFIYPDKFSETKDEYLKRIGDKDEAGYLTKEGFFRKNSKESGQYHSNWLSMMYPRLFLARNLLCEDGVIFVSIDDNEVHNLRLMMNEIFGEENFAAQLVWKKKYIGGKHARHFVDLHEYVLVFAKNIDYLDEILIDRPEREMEKFEYEDQFVKERGKYYIRPLKSNLERRDTLVYAIKLPDDTQITTQWMVARNTFDDLVRDGRILFRQKKDGAYQVYRKFYEFDNEGLVKMPTLIDDVANADGKVEVKEIFNTKEGRDIVFSNPKPSGLIRHLSKPVVKDGDIMLDFFAGSGTTAHAILELNKEDGGNRKFILVQLAEKTEEDSEAYKAGYKTIADICKERIRRVCKRIKEEVEKKAGLFAEKKLDLGFKAFTLESSNFKIWRTDTIESEEDLKHQMEAFVDPVRGRSEAEDMAWEILLKSGYELTTPMERIEVAGVPTYSIADGELILFLEAVSQEAIDAIIARKPKRVICLDRLFSGNDQLKTNTALQMKDAGVEFRTI
jgi:adenine-specific DNA-methyltransferase